MRRFACPYLGGEVELGESREVHIAEAHPDLLPAHRRLLVQTLADPDAVRLSARSSNARLFTRWYDGLRGGKYVVVAVVSEAATGRHWVVTAYAARKLAEGVSEWRKD
jgi:hypothetical protein